MPWQELQIIVDADDLSRAEALLLLAGAAAFSLSGASDEEFLEPGPGETPVWASVSLRALFPPATPLRSVASTLQEALGLETAIEIRAVPDEAWEGTWQRRPATRRIGRRLLLAAADAETSDGGRTVVRLNLGLAFGTGEHPSTAMCLEWLDKELSPGARIMDYGCGSGVLAVAALRLGAACAWAVDIDPQALTAARSNARLNGVQSRLWMGTPEQMPAVEVDVVLANILAVTLESLAGLFARCVKPGGRVVLSGILENQVSDLRRRYEDFFGPFTVREADGWILLAAPRRREAV